MTDIPALFKQESISEFIDRSLEEQRIPHAFIIKGPADGGSFEIADYFARKVSGDPDIKVVDFLENPGDYTKTVRSQVVDNLILRPYRRVFKVYILKGADTMSEGAQNALLKSLEEPPDYAVIILLCTNSSRLLPTIRSRTIELSIKPLAASEIREYVLKHESTDESTADMISQLSGGSLSKALQILKNDDYIETANDLSRVISALCARKDRITLDYKAQIESFSQKTDIFLELMEMFLRDVLVYKLTLDRTKCFYRGWMPQVDEVKNSLSLPALGKIQRRLKAIGRQYEHNAGADTLIEILFNELPVKGDNF